MFLDSARVPSGGTVSADVCIVGSGPAGIALARELAPHARVLLVEAGGLEYDRASHELYRGRVTGSMWDAVMERDPTDYLLASRHRYFGGSSNCWAGYCRPLDPTVFAARPWIPHSGWPIGRADLEPYYERASRLCDIENLYSADGAENGRRFPSGTKLRAAIEYKSPPTRFGRKYRDELRRSAKVGVLFNGSVSELVCSPAGEAIDWLRVRTLAGNWFAVVAGTYVLATGGIENARLLLSSDGVQKNGIGNESGLVGRFFMDHLYPTAVPGVAALTRTFWKGVADYDAFGIWTLDPQTVARHRMLNVGIAFETLGVAPTETAQAVLAVAGAIDRSEGTEPAVSNGLLTRLRLHVELSPNPDNRVTLVDERDALGMRRVSLHWDLTELDRHSIERALALYSAALGGSLAGRLAVGKLQLNRAFGSHHLGTTRMSTDPRRGVVDADCRVHGMTNLFVAGSSVFPTGGFENPTFTILALALRLGDHLREGR